VKGLARKKKERGALIRRALARSCYRWAGHFLFFGNLISKVRENDGVQLGFLFAYEVFSLGLGLFSPCFSSFCRKKVPARPRHAPPLPQENVCVFI
jgi:hypothetical protein